MKQDPNSTYIFFKDEDIESRVVSYVFKSVDFEYNPMSGRPLKFDYLDLLNTTKWQGLEPSKYIPILKAMCRNYIKHLPS